MKSIFLNSIVFILVAFFSVTNLIGQETEEHDHHHHSNSEIGISGSVYYFVVAEEYNPGIHLHYVYYFTHSKFGLGAGYERLFDEHGHNTFGVIGTYSPVKRLILAVSPGFTFEDEEPSNLFPAMHVEATYGFDLGIFHLGPSLGYAVTTEDQHISVGIHLGIGL